jgi:tRNA(fMet)-specific endonuclease VapC
VKVLDTDHCLALLRGRLDLRQKASPDDELATTSITVAELLYGAYKSERAAHNLAAVDALLSVLVILDFNEAAARLYGQMRALLEKNGQRLSDLDLQIASIALAWNLALVTHNHDHFARLSDFTQLILDDWLTQS